MRHLGLGVMDSGIEAGNLRGSGEQANPVAVAQSLSRLRGRRPPIGIERGPRPWLPGDSVVPGPIAHPAPPASPGAWALPDMARPEMGRPVVNPVLTPGAAPGWPPPGMLGGPLLSRAPNDRHGPFGSIVADAHRWSGRVPNGAAGPGPPAGPGVLDRRTLLMRLLGQL